jgi:septin family protein
MRCVRKKTSPVLKPTKTIPRVRASLTTKPYPEFNFRHKFSLLVVGPSQSGKTYFVQQILENNRIVYEEQRSIRILWCYNQWQDRYDDLRKSLGKSIRFERGLPELSEKYNNIIILDDLMAEATDSPVVSRLFTQGRHRNASVILLRQNMF